MSWKVQSNSTTSLGDVKRRNGEAMEEVRAVVKEYEGRKRSKETPHQDVSDVAGPASGYVDIEYIRGKISVVEVARELGLRVRSETVAHCWRIENHAHDDADPSIRFQRKRNRWCCFVCDEKGAASNFDLVIGVLGCDFRSAVSWIAQRWPVPSAPKGRHTKRRQGWDPTYRVGASGDRLEWLVRSGLWAELTKAQKSILPVLSAYTNETGLATISYRGIARYAGVGSHDTVRRALLRFQKMRLLQIDRSLGSDGYRAVSSYRLTFDDPTFLSLLNEIHLKQKEEIDLERTFRAEERRRQRKRRQKPIERPVAPV